MPLFALVVGLILTALVCSAGLLFRSWTARRRCPECGDRTTPTRGAVPLPEAIERRWCGQCGWSGVGRAGPRFDPQRGPVHHDSGFIWRSGRSGRAPEFRWRYHEAPPAGFRFSEPGEPEPAEARGFRWADDG